MVLCGRSTPGLSKGLGLCLALLVNGRETELVRFAGCWKQGRTSSLVVGRGHRVDAAKRAWERMAQSWLFAIAFVLLTFVPGRAQGQDQASEPLLEKTRPDFVLGHWASEVPLAGLAVTAVVASAEHDQVSYSGHAPDAGFHSYSKTADIASDVTGDVAGAVFSLAIGSSLEWLHLRDASFLYSSMIAAEAWLIGSGITRYLKHSIGRCRPIAWNEESRTCDSRLSALGPEIAEEFGSDEAYQAMPSGHVAGVSAVSGAYLWMALESAEPAPLRWAAFAASQSLALATVGLRVEAGAHSWSDTLVSWGLNTLVGMSVAALHGRRSLTRRQVGFRLIPLGQGVVVAGTFR